MFSETPSYRSRSRMIALPKAANDNALSPGEYLRRLAERSRMTQMFLRQADQRLREIKSLLKGSAPNT